MQRVAAGTATCALCRRAVRADDDVLITPDFLADDSDPLWPFTDALLHRNCFLLWDRRKAFVARYNGVARRLVAEDGSYPHMTGEGAIVRRHGGPTRKGPGRSPPSA